MLVGHTERLHMMLSPTAQCRLQGGAGQWPLRVISLCQQALLHRTQRWPAGQRHSRIAIGFSQRQTQHMGHALRQQSCVQAQRRQCLAVFYQQSQLLAGNHQQRQRVMAVAAVMNVTDMQRLAAIATELGAGPGGVGVVFHYQQGVKESTQSGMTLNVRQSQTVLFHQMRVLLLYGRKLGPEGLISVGLNPHRQGIEEQANLIGQTVNGRATSGHRRAKQYVVAPGYATQDLSPDALHQYVEGNPLTPQPLHQRLGFCRG